MSPLADSAAGARSKPGREAPFFLKGPPGAWLKVVLAIKGEVLTGSSPSSQSRGQRVNMELGGSNVITGVTGDQKYLI